MTVQYNHLNLPVHFEWLVDPLADAYRHIWLTYDQTGQKLRKQVVETSGTLYTQDYVGGLEYRTNAGGSLTLEAIYHAEGRITPNAGAYRYEYTIKDHLGNARISFADLNDNKIVDVPGDILQENHYYPFGLNMNYAWMNNSGLSDQKYLYNDKELNDDFGLNLSDYGARWYDAAVGRWWSVDPMGEKFINITPYNYVVNNPVLMIDLFGMESKFYDNGNMDLEGADAQNYFRGLQAQQKEMNDSNKGKLESGNGAKLRNVKLTVTNEIVGKARVSGYSHEGGRTDDEFEVPLYTMTIEGTDEDGNKQSREFSVIRFGVSQKKTGGAANVVGLANSQSYTIKSWNGKYLYGEEDITPGAWRITGSWLLHDGADAPLKDAWGAIGCIEVCGRTVGNEDDHFTGLNWLIRDWSGAKNATGNAEFKNQLVAKSGALSIHFQRAKVPPLVKL
jgi:RHS repeat-associated protein